MISPEHQLAAKVAALEYLVGAALSLLYRQAGYPMHAIVEFHDDILASAQTVSVGGPDPAQADLRSAEFAAELERMVRSLEAVVAVTGAGHAEAVESFDILPPPSRDSW